jgi:hypothetical protein
VTALHPQKVPGSTIFVAFTVVARHSDNSRQLRGYGLHGYARRHSVPRWHHAFPRLGRFLTHGTTTVVRSKLPETVPMNRVPTGHFVRGTPGIKEIFLTDRAVAPVLAGLAIVIAVETAVNAHTTFVAVLKVFLSAHAAKAAVGTMVGTFVGRHPQVANVAMVGTKLYPARDTAVRFAALTCKAFTANDFHDSKPINVVVVIFRELGHGFHAGKATRQRGTAMKAPTAIVDLWGTVNE